MKLEFAAIPHQMKPLLSGPTTVQYNTIVSGDPIWCPNFGLLCVSQQQLMEEQVPQGVEQSMWVQWR